MEIETKKRLAVVLRAAASQTISEPDFWERFNGIESPSDDPFSKIAYQTAVHFWGTFHEKNLLLMPTKPDRYQVRQGRDQLNLIAEALEENWLYSELMRKLDDI
ncbi:MAG: hypothetical protein LAN64_17155 [Acidobacteriia bacterium]|nr:hypothetical protein [Terriglobia bacterium]